MDDPAATQTSPDTIDDLNDERLRRSEENARGWWRNMMVAIALLAVAAGFWTMR